MPAPMTPLAFEIEGLRSLLLGAQLTLDVKQRVHARIQKISRLANPGEGAIGDDAREKISRLEAQVEEQGNQLGEFHSRLWQLMWMLTKAWDVIGDEKMAEILTTRPTFSGKVT